MSVFFANINVRSGDQKAVASAFRRLPRRQAAWIAPPVHGWVTVFEQISDEETDEDRLSGYTVMLSGHLKTVALGVMVYDSDVLTYTLADTERLIDQYSSWPDYFDENMPEAEQRRLRGNPEALASIPGSRATPDEVRRVLRHEHDFAEEKLEELAALLGLPEHSARWGFTFLEEPEDPGDRPERWDEFLKVEAAFGMAGG